MSEPDAAKLRWNDLPETLRADLFRKLEGLYGHADAATAFDALAGDKQQALLLFADRLRALNLWREIESIENIYGVGGVGMNFRARRGLGRALAAHDRFTSRFAAHADCAEGFFERGRARAALHLLRTKGDASRWSIHFDLHAPAATPLSALRHFWSEKVRGETPDWEAIKSALV
ncbi:MAG TPA: hypothetical protein VEZ40_09190 [Pyrinomonadaceae bacterium]|nr:hypothetical protein [Pyrinomonadaceae bacterium]